MSQILVLVVASLVLVLVLVLVGLVLVLVLACPVLVNITARFHFARLLQQYYKCKIVPSKRSIILVID